MKYVIWFKSKTVENNTGFYFRNRKVGFTGVPTADRARKFITGAEVRKIKTLLEAKEGEYYDFEIQEVEA